MYILTWYMSITLSLYRDYSYPLTLYLSLILTPLKLNLGTYSSSQREIKFRHCLFAFSIKVNAKLGIFMSLLCKNGKEMYKKTVIHVQSCCFTY